MNPLLLFRSPLAIGGLLLVSAFGMGFHLGGSVERARGDRAALEQQIETLKADMRLADAARRSEAAKAATLDELTRRQEIELDALRIRLNALPAAGRQLAPADALDRLYPPAR